MAEEKDDIEQGDEFESGEAVYDLTEEGLVEAKPELQKLFLQHPECILDYVETVIPKLQQTFVVPGGKNIDPNHRTYPFLTTFERTKIIGLRANQISRGSVPFVVVPRHITDVRDIARLELEQKRLPYMIKRPLPNGTFEYWRLADLLLL